MTRLFTKKQFAGYRWHVGPLWNPKDPDMSAWSIHGRFGHVQRVGGRRVLAIVSPRRASVARRLGFDEIDRGDSELYVRATLPDDPEQESEMMRALADLCGFRARRRMTPAALAQRRAAGANTRLQKMAEERISQAAIQRTVGQTGFPTPAG